MTPTNPPKEYNRFEAAQRFEHIVLIVTFTGLALTGLPQKFAEEGWARLLLNIMGGIESARIIHHVLATILMAEAIYHGGVISYKVFVLGRRATMIPGLKDLWDFRDWILYNLGAGEQHPHMPRYNFGEKAEYLAVVWGTIVMVITGFMMWNPIATTRFLPGEVIPAARAAHGAEALLAVLSIVTWHMYNVHFKRFNRSMFTGNLPREVMEEEHGGELDAIERGEKPSEVPADVLASRKRRFVPYAAGMTVLLVGGLIWFTTFEQTAIATEPRRTEVVFAPQALPVQGDPKVGEAIWGTLRCAFCHGADAREQINGSPILKDTKLTFGEFYQQVRKGSDKMPAFSAEELPDGYLLHIWTWLTNKPNPEATPGAEATTSPESTPTAESTFNPETTSAP